MKQNEIKENLLCDTLFSNKRIFVKVNAQRMFLLKDAKMKICFVAQQK